MATMKIVTFRTSDHRIVDLEEEFAVLMLTIKRMIEDKCANEVIPLPNVRHGTFVKVIEYCKKHGSEPAEEDGYYIHGEKEMMDLEAWDEGFVNEAKDDLPDLFNLITAANYLEVPTLLELLCRAVAEMMRGKTPEQIRQTFNIFNDYTPEEEEAVRRENEWAFK